MQENGRNQVQERMAHNSQNESGDRSPSVKPENRVKGMSYLERKGHVEA